MSKELEALVNLMEDVNQCVNSGGIRWIDSRNYYIVEKGLKALEILKNKVVFYWQLRFFENYDNYFIATYSEENKDNILTRNEFNLIKEWLNNGD